MNGWRGEKTRGQNEEKRNKQSFANDKNVQIQIQVNIKSVIFLKRYGTIKTFLNIIEMEKNKNIRWKRGGKGRWVGREGRG